MRRDIRLYIEAELRHYHDTKRDYNLLREELMATGTDSTTERIGSTPCRVSKPTEQSAVKLVTNPRLRNMDAVLSAIEKVLFTLEPIEQKFVKLYYWDRRFRMEGVAEELNCHRATLYRWRDKICYSIAEHLGLLN